jgi:hypothetical protein
LLRADIVVYSNITNFTGTALANGGAELQGTNTITRMLLDDLTLAYSPSYGDLKNFTFSVANLNTTTVSARARIRFFNDNGSNAPGTYLLGFTTLPISLAASSVALFSSNVNVAFAANQKIWAGITFDDNNGTTGATLAQMNNLGVGLYDAPTLGSSADQFFLTTAAGSFASISNPAGSIITGSGNPRYNAGWAITTSVPEPGALSLLMVCGLAASCGVRRRLA